MKDKKFLNIDNVQGYIEESYNTKRYDEITSLTEDVKEEIYRDLESFTEKIETETKSKVVSKTILDFVTWLFDITAYTVKKLLNVTAKFFKGVYNKFKGVFAAVGKFLDSWLQFLSTKGKKMIIKESIDPAMLNNLSQLDKGYNKKIHTEVFIDPNEQYNSQQLLNDMKRANKEVSTNIRPMQEGVKGALVGIGRGLNGAVKFTGNTVSATRDIVSLVFLILLVKIILNIYKFLSVVVTTIAGGVAALIHLIPQVLVLSLIAYLIYRVYLGISDYLMEANTKNKADIRPALNAGNEYANSVLRDPATTSKAKSAIHEYQNGLNDTEKNIQDTYTLFEPVEQPNKNPINTSV